MSKKTQSTKRRWRMTRRGFLLGAGATLALGIPVGLPLLRTQIANTFINSSGQPSNTPNDPFAWFEITNESRIRLYITKVEMGQGVHTAIAQIAVEELGLDVADIEVVQASSAEGFVDTAGTGGSGSVRSTFTPLLEAAATFRHLLQQEAASTLGVAATTLKMTPTGLQTGDQTLSFRDIIDAKAGEWELPETQVALKNHRDFRVIGQPIGRHDIPGKVTGEAIYGYDMRLPDMLYGAVAQPPTLSRTIESVAIGDVMSMPGVRYVAVDQSINFVGVVAETRLQARAALGNIDIRWAKKRNWQQEEIDQVVRAEGTNGVILQDKGNTTLTLSRAVTHSAEYRSPFAIQATLEPQASLADVRDGRVRVWASTQNQAYTRNRVAEALAIEADTVTVTPTYLGGGFGRKLSTESAVEAARLSKAVGAPVHVGWTRGDMLRNGYFRPPTHHTLRAKLDENGRIAAFEHRQASAEVAFSFFPGFLRPLMGADFGSYLGASISYENIPDRLTIAWLKRVPVQTGWWRGLGLLANTFATESFMDDLAHIAGADPLQYRLDHLGESEPQRRIATVLQAAAAQAGWGTPPPEGRARGISAHDEMGTTVANIVEISLTDDGRIRVHKITAAVDCGLVINPNGAKAQIEGGTMWGISSALVEEAIVRDGAMYASNFDRYPLLSLRESADIDVILIDSDRNTPSGLGEPPVGSVAAAIGNAFFALTGQRLTQLPMNQTRVQTALHEAGVA